MGGRRGRRSCRRWWRRARKRLWAQVPPVGSVTINRRSLPPVAGPRSPGRSRDDDDRARDTPLRPSQLIRRCSTPAVARRGGRRGGETRGGRRGCGGGASRLRGRGGGGGRGGGRGSTVRSVRGL